MLKNEYISKKLTLNFNNKIIYLILSLNNNFKFNQTKDETEGQKSN